MLIIHDRGTVMPQKKKARAKKTLRKAGAKRRSNAKPTAAAATKRRIPTTVSGKQQFLDTFAREFATTMKVLRAYPANQFDFRPHMRAKSARELAWTFVIEQNLLDRAFSNEPMFAGGGPPPAPNDFQAILVQLEADQQKLVEKLRRIPEDDFHDIMQFPTGPGQMGDWSKLAFAWFILSDHIHHRGQYSVYVRMAGGKVPSIYGPSADEPWR